MEPGASNSNRHNDDNESEDEILQQETLAGAVMRQRALQVQRQNQSARQHSPDIERGLERAHPQAASWTEGADGAYAAGSDRFVSPTRARAISQSFSELVHLFTHGPPQRRMMSNGRDVPGRRRGLPSPVSSL